MKRSHSEPSLNGTEEEDLKVVIRMPIPPSKRKEAIIILRSLIEETRLQRGCSSSCLYQDVMSGQFLMIEELWTSRLEMERHFTSDQFLSLLLVMEMATEPPEVRIEQISDRSGIDAIERVRAKRAQLA